MRPTDSNATARAAQRVAWIALGGGLVIMALKFAVYALTHSAAVLSDAMESVVNIVAAAMAAFSTWYAARPADREHPYGHGNIEFIAVGVEGTLIAVAGLVIIAESVRRLWLGLEPQQLDAGMIALGGINVLLLGLAVYIRRRAGQLDSPTLVADGNHLLVDCLTTLAVVAALAAVGFTGWTWLDPAAGIVMALLIVYAGLRLIRQSLGGLLDESDLAEHDMLAGLLDRRVEAGHILSYHKLRHRHIGAYHWVDMHIQFPAEMTVARAHEIASAIEYEIEQSLGHANATAHIEPPQ